ncbi:hypothetical protein SO802_027197 [Lithocarpus litseifolius]|uniref:Uncharacterized protein n=1 Tax=Lithocarpus litseifolius TaxID=425828 RepID=A0AAW2C3R6_9ROSI
MSCRGAASMVADIVKIEEGSQNPIFEAILEIMISVVIFLLAELVKIGLEGFAIIDKYYGRPRRSGTGRPYYPPPGYQYSSQFSQMKEPINNSNMPNSNTAGHANYRGIHSELR